MILGRFRIQPEENRKFTIDYSERLAAGDEIRSVKNVMVEPVTDPKFVAAASVHPDGDKVVVYATGGLSLQDYKVEVQVGTTDARVVWEDELIFIVEDI